MSTSGEERHERDLPEEMYVTLLYWLALAIPGFAVLCVLDAGELRSGALGTLGLSYLWTLGLLPGSLPFLLGRSSNLAPLELVLDLLVALSCPLARPAASAVSSLASRA